MPSNITQLLTIASILTLSTQAFTLTPTIHPTTTLAMSSTTQMTPLSPGLLKRTTTPPSGPPLQFGDVATIRYTCMTEDGTIFAQSPSQKVVVGDGVMIKGWELGLKTMAVGERAVVRIEDAGKFGYGEAGVPPVVEGGAVLEIDMEVLEREDAPSVGSAGGLGVGGVADFFQDGSGGIGMLDPNKPRTPQAIAEAYKVRQDVIALTPVKDLDGLEWWIDKLNTSYFFGLFEGETGQQTPWILRPSITFPIVFAICGAALLVTVLGGGVSERGLPRTDDLDEVILTLNAIDAVVRGVVV